MSAGEDRARLILSKVLKVKSESINLEDDLVTKYNMDSMQRVEIVIELENQFDVVISDDISITLRTLGQILDFIKTVSNKQP